MTIVNKVWTLTGKNSLPDQALKNIVKSHIAEEEYLKTVRLNILDKQTNNLFSSFSDDLKKELNSIIKNITWSTEGHNLNETITVDDLKKSLIKPRAEKSREEQKKRVKEKAEVFTPMWVCNIQNNLIDNSLLRGDFFNTVDPKKQTLWIPTKSPITFPEDYPWFKYVSDKRLEMAAGEAPYLMSSYDTTTGVNFPVRNESGNFQRIGLLDRKLRIVSENTNNIKDWFIAAKIALHSIYGYEWQGDNLVLARLNMINTFFDYYSDFITTNSLKDTSRKEKEEIAIEISEIASWQLWQMDGLKQITPESCTENCNACKTKEMFKHDGQHPVIKWGSDKIIFEELLYTKQF